MKKLAIILCLLPIWAYADTAPLPPQPPAQSPDQVIMLQNKQIGFLYSQISALQEQIIELNGEIVTLNAKIKAGVPPVAGAADGK